MPTSNSDLLLVDDTLWVITERVGLAVYDFDFTQWFPCRRPWRRPERVTAVARVGAPVDYRLVYDSLRNDGIDLINDPEAHQLATELPSWYPLLEGMTPKSRWYEHPPPPGVIADEVGWPVFIKGARQTSKHDASLAIAHNTEEYHRLAERYIQDSVLHWQPMVAREYVALEPVGTAVGGSLPPAFEFRTFWWKGHLVGDGPYWSEFVKYGWTDAERRSAVRLAETVATRLEVPFLVVDLARTAGGDWIVIEVNDGQESGYAGVSRVAMWQRVIELERS